MEPQALLTISVLIILARWRYHICVDTVVTKNDDFNNHPTNLTKILELFSSKKNTDRASVDQFTKKEI